MEIVTRHRDTLERGAAMLLQKEKIEAEEIEALMSVSENGLEGGMKVYGDVE